MSADLNSITEEVIRNLTRLFLGHLPPRPDPTGRGIIIAVGGTQYFANAWVCIGMLRRCGCKLPIQVWCWNEEDFDTSMRNLLAGYAVQTKVIPDGKKNLAGKNPGAQELKIVAALEAPFKEVLVLDADNVPIVNPEALFDSPEFLHHGAVLWPSRKKVQSVGVEKFSIRRSFAVKSVELDLGQILLNKSTTWDVLNLALLYARYSEFFYPILGGFQGVLQLSFLNVRRKFSVPARLAVELPSTLCHHDFAGNRIFQHRHGTKWDFYQENTKIEGFLREQECFDLLSELKVRWSGKRRTIPFDLSGKSLAVQRVAAIIISGLFEYRRIGHGARSMTFLTNGDVGVGSAGCELFWDIHEENGEICIEIASEQEKTCILRRRTDGVWCGQWLHHEKNAVELVPIKTSLPRNQAQRVAFSAPINSYTGYGLHACEIIRGLEAHGYNVSVRPASLEEKFAPIPADVSEKFVAGIQTDEWELVLQIPPAFNPVPGKRVVLYTMWESTQLPPLLAARLNQADHIIVPCQWNKECFTQSGVSKPIHVVPLGIHEEVFRYSPMNMVGPCIFGAAGRMADGGIRKGINDVIRAFSRAFPVESDVRLLVKGFPDCDILESTDKRIRVVKAFLRENELSQWFASLTCFVSGAKGEGWGLMQHQAIACGRPVISVAFGGLTEFFDDKVGYPVNFKLGRAQGRYKEFGNWAEPDQKHLIERMRHIYKNRGEARQIGKFGAQRIARFTWENSTLKLITILQHIGMLN